MKASQWWAVCLGEAYGKVMAVACQARHHADIFGMLFSLQNSPICGEPTALSFITAEKARAVEENNDGDLVAVCVARHWLF